MPLYLNDLDVVSEAVGMNSALIVPCNMCPAVTLAVKENEPFMRLFKSLFTSAPFERYIRTLRSRLREKGVHTKVFRSRIYHHWFLCMWSSGRRKKLQRYAKQFDSVIVLGCVTATETIRDALQSAAPRVIEGMEVAGFMNAKLRLHLPCDLSFSDCKIIPQGQHGGAR